VITSPGRIRIRLKLKGAGARKEQATGDDTTEVAENTKKVSKYNGAVWEQKQTDSEYEQHGKYQDE
jgi:hypothetical protein